MSKTLQITQIQGDDYHLVWQRMRSFTDTRDASVSDQLWLTEHQPVFTFGQAGKPEHLLMAGDIPVHYIDRGGQVTYHGPGQLMAYLLIDLKRLGLGVRQLVTAMEQAVIAVLKLYQIEATALSDAPGVYVDGAKISALGLRIRRGCSYHGLALNIDMDLSPFKQINPCGYAGMAVTDCRRLGITASFECLQKQLIEQLCHQLVYVETEWLSETK